MGTTENAWSDAPSYPSKTFYIGDGYREVPPEYLSVGDSKDVWYIGYLGVGDNIQISYEGYSGAVHGSYAISNRLFYGKLTVLNSYGVAQISGSSINADVNVAGDYYVAVENYQWMWDAARAFGYSLDKTHTVANNLAPIANNDSYSVEAGASLFIRSWQTNSITKNDSDSDSAESQLNYSWKRMAR